MAPTIRIDDQVWGVLKGHAEPLEDTPNDVLRRLLGLDSARPRGKAVHTRDVRDTVASILQTMIQEDGEFELDEPSKTYVCFAPLAWDSEHLLTGSRASGRILLFFFENRETLRLHLEIQPGDERVRRHIHASLLGQKPFSSRQKLSPVYNRIFRFDFLSTDDYAEHGDDLAWIKKRIKERWAHFKGIMCAPIDNAVKTISWDR
jgi:hypothetical protein